MADLNADKPADWSTFSGVRRVTAVFENIEQGRDAVRALTSAGVPAGDIHALSGTEGATKLDVGGHDHSWGVRMLRKLELVLADESEVNKEYDQWLKKGALVLNIETAGSDDVKRATVETLQARGAHPIHYWGQWTIEKLA